MATLAGSQTESQGDVRFARAAVAQQQYVLAAGKVLASPSSSTRILFSVGMARKSKLSWS
jgi:hypothetical protein